MANARGVVTITDVTDGQSTVSIFARSSIVPTSVPTANAAVVAEGLRFEGMTDPVPGMPAQPGATEIYTLNLASVRTGFPLFMGYSITISPDDDPDNSVTFSVADNTGFGNFNSVNAAANALVNNMNTRGLAANGWLAANAGSNPNGGVNITITASAAGVRTPNITMRFQSFATSQVNFRGTDGTLSGNWTANTNPDETNNFITVTEGMDGVPEIPAMPAEPNGVFDQLVSNEWYVFETGPVGISRLYSRSADFISSPILPTDWRAPVAIDGVSGQGAFRRLHPSINRPQAPSVDSGFDNGWLPAPSGGDLRLNWETTSSSQGTETGGNSPLQQITLDGMSATPTITTNASRSFTLGGMQTGQNTGGIAESGVIGISPSTTVVGGLADTSFMVSNTDASDRSRVDYTVTTATQPGTTGRVRACNDGYQFNVSNTTCQLPPSDFHTATNGVGGVVLDRTFNNTSATVGRPHDIRITTPIPRGTTFTVEIPIRAYLSRAYFNDAWFANPSVASEENNGIAYGQVFVTGGNGTWAGNETGGHITLDSATEPSGHVRRVSNSAAGDIVVYEDTLIIEISVASDATPGVETGATNWSSVFYGFGNDGSGEFTSSRSVNPSDRPNRIFYTPTDQAITTTTGNDMVTRFVVDGTNHDITVNAVTQMEAADEWISSAQAITALNSAFNFVRTSENDIQYTGSSLRNHEVSTSLVSQAGTGGAFALDTNTVVNGVTPSLVNATRVNLRVGSASETISLPPLTGRDTVGQRIATDLTAVNNSRYSIAYTDSTDTFLVTELLGNVTDADGMGSQGIALSLVEAGDQGDLSITNGAATDAVITDVPTRWRLCITYGDTVVEPAVGTLPAGQTASQFISVLETELQGNGYFDVSRLGDNILVLSGHFRAPMVASLEFDEGGVVSTAVTASNTQAVSGAYPTTTGLTAAGWSSVLPFQAGIRSVAGQGVTIITTDDVIFTG